MALFNFNKNKNTENKPTVNTIQQKRPSESLGRVLSESVPSAALDIIVNNKKFELRADENGNKRYLVIILDVNTIGGLTKAILKNDQDKGQFVECINCGNIEAYVSSELILVDKFVIIPTEKSVESLSEFLFVASNNFKSFIPTVCVIDENGNMMFNELPANVDFEWFSNVSNSNMTIKEALGKINADKYLTENVLEESASNVLVKETNISSDTSEESNISESNLDVSVQNVFADEDEEDEEDVFSIPLDNDIESFDNSEEDSLFEIENETENIEETTVHEEYQCPICGNYINKGDVECPYCNAELDVDINVEDIVKPDNKETIIEDVSDKEVIDAVERLFHAGDLDLEISANPFDVRIIGENEYLPLIEERNDTWLDSYVTQLIKNANEELRLLHKQNLTVSRQRYLSLMTNNAEDIANKVDIHNAETDFYKMFKFFEHEKENKKSQIDDKVALRRAEMEEKWQEQLEQIKASAAMAAERNYLENHSKAHEAMLRDCEITALDELEREYKDNLQQLNVLRKEEAQKMFDIAVTETLEVIGRSYKELLCSENEKRTELLDNINKYVDEHLKDEVARNAVLAETQRQKEEADKVIEDFNRKIETLSAEHKITCDKLQNDLLAAYSHEETVKRDYDSKLHTEADRYKELEEKYKELMDKYVNIENIKAKEYETRINTLENDKKAVEEHLAHVDVIHNKFNKVSIVVWIAIAIAMFAIGTLLGNAMNKTSVGSQYSISLTGSDGSEDAEESK